MVPMGNNYQCHIMVGSLLYLLFWVGKNKTTDTTFPLAGVLADVKKEIRAHGVFWTGIGLWPQIFFPTIYGPILTVEDKP
jgi:hypothetical protein